MKAYLLYINVKSGVYISLRHKKNLNSAYKKNYKLIFPLINKIFTFFFFKKKIKNLNIRNDKVDNLQSKFKHKLFVSKALAVTTKESVKEK